MGKKIEIFKPGRHTASDGRPYDITAEQVAAGALAYDPAVHEAPLVVGHPAADQPAYGWVTSLAFGESLVAEADQVEPAFAEMVAAGRFKKVSASFYLPESPTNPKPGVLYLRHVGFLGAQPPAVKGLRAPQFAEGEEGVVDFVEEGNLYSTLADLLRNLRDWIIGSGGVEEADRILPNWQVENVSRIANQTREAEGKANASFFEGDPMDKAEMERKEADLSRREAEVTAREAAFSERETALTAAEKATARAGVAEFVEGLVKEGRVLPHDKAGLVEFMAGQPVEAVVEFAEGGAQVKKPAGEWLKVFLSALPKQVEFAEVAPGSAGIPADNPQAVADEARKYMDEQSKTGRSISFTEAVEHVSKGGAK